MTSIPETPIATIRYTDTHVLALCPLGHLLMVRDVRNWAGSQFAADVAFRRPGDHFDRLAATCDGAGHADDGKAVT